MMRIRRRLFIILLMVLTIPFVILSKTAFTEEVTGGTTTAAPTDNCTERDHVDVALVVDRSGSMSGDAIVDAKEAIIQFVGLMDFSRDQAALVHFSSYAILDVPLTQDATVIIDAIQAISAGGSTDIAEAIRVAHAELTGPNLLPENKPVIVLLSDGKSSHFAAVRAAEDAKADGIQIVTIGLGEVDQELMKELASSENDYYYVPTSDQLDEIYEAINIAISCLPEPTTAHRSFVPLVMSNGGCTTHTPADVMLVVDTSSSMSGQPFIDVEVAVNRFVNLMDLSVDQVGLVSFNQEAILEHPLTQNPNAIKDALRELSPHDQTNIAAAIQAAHAELQSNHHLPGNRSVIILLSDGDQSEPGDPLIPAAVAKDDNIQVITIGLGHPHHLDFDTLQGIASSQFAFYHAPASADLVDIYQTVAARVACS